MALVPFGRPKGAKAQRVASNPMPDQMRESTPSDSKFGVGYGNPRPAEGVGPVNDGNDVFVGDGERSGPARPQAPRKPAVRFDR